jgi:S-methylmethionine-dependent homocysteine/selenocysteine methylase
MAKYRDHLPQLSGKFFITDGGLETTLVFHLGLDLPDFAAFDLLKDESGRETLREYFRSYATIAKNHGLGFILESPTWRANADWGTKQGHSENKLAEINRAAIALLEEIRAELESDKTPMVISGCVGPRGDGYVPGTAMSADAAQAYHLKQIQTFKDTAADLVAATTMNYVDEAIGISRAAKSVQMPVVISFTVETDGKLPTGQSLKDAITTVDAATNNAPAYYMINCAHPTHFADVLSGEGTWLNRIAGVRANSSVKSHAELNESTILDEGNPGEFGAQHKLLLERLKHLRVLGGCCGTDQRHIKEICKSCFAPET